MTVDTGRHGGSPAASSWVPVPATEGRSREPEDSPRHEEGDPGNSGSPEDGDGSTAGETFSVQRSGGQVRLTVRAPGAEIAVTFSPNVAAWLAAELSGPTSLR